MADDGIGDVAHEGSFHSPEPAAAYHYQAGPNILGQVDDRFVPPFVHLQVGDRDGTARLFDLPDLLVQYLLSLAPEVLTRRLGIDIVDGGRERASDRDDVESRVGALCEVDRRRGRQRRVRRSIGGQQDARWEDTQPGVLS